MTDDIDTLSGPELSAAVAREVMGWSDHFCGDGGWWSDDDGHTADCDGREAWQPHTDRNDAHRVLMRCKALGIAARLWFDIQAGNPRGCFEWDWSLLTIDPAIICRAARRAVRESK